MTNQEVVRVALSLQDIESVSVLKESGISRRVVSGVIAGENARKSLVIAQVIINNTYCSACPLFIANECEPSTFHFAKPGHVVIENYRQAQTQHQDVPASCPLDGKVYEFNKSQPNLSRILPLEKQTALATPTPPESSSI